MKLGLRNSIKDAAKRAVETGTSPRWFTAEQWGSIIDEETKAKLMRKCLRGIKKALNAKPSKVDLPTIRLWVAIGLKGKRR